ncbi:hypothetical protein [Streptomyces botrytidirepellens]|uniref:Uncharacterized protein n=1 Tax=Streptomyces botrytidirepellens TaxID=2486417 RepID=A0A3M8US54_9ACTN|nr:hypothetical protein [Streptomyces botrytidirepellens]RNG08208.1 hypothetical protein EEJ42_33445 [Streptomyces botrytidirepellens]
MSSFSDEQDHAPGIFTTTRVSNVMYAHLRGRGGLGGHYCADLSTIRPGERVALHDARLCRTVIGIVDQAEHDTNAVTFRFASDRFRVLHGTEPVMAHWRTYRWHSPATAPYVHAIVHTTDSASAPYTDRYAPVPGRSIAHVDVTGHGGPDDAWHYGTPYRSDLGRLAPWCLHCGHPMATGEPETPPAPCRSGYGHHPVRIWTPYSWACATPSQNITLTNDYRAHDGQPPIDPFNTDDINQAITYYLTDTIEWYDSAMFGIEYVLEESAYLQQTADVEDTTACHPPADPDPWHPGNAYSDEPPF